VLDASAEEYFASLGLESSVRQLRKTREYLAENIVGEPTNKARVLFAELQNRLTEELEQRLFYYLPLERARQYQDPLSGWSAARTAFPSIEPEVVEAVRCLAFERPTASVFHAMRVLERGLRVLAARLHVPMHKVKDATWEGVIVAIERKIADLRPQPAIKRPRLSKSRRKVTWERYAELAQQFRYFKDVWRNHAMHDDASYNEEQAAGILRSVCDFMNEMATKLEES
jgi:hypothetical protein